MRGLLVWVCVFGAVPQSEDPELPPVQKVTLSLDNIPAIEALSRFSRATGCPMEFYRGRHGDGVEQSDLAKGMTLELKEVPFYEALERFCRAHGNLSYELDDVRGILFMAQPIGPSKYSRDGRFVFWDGAVEENLRSDFSKTTKECRVSMGMAWQPNLHVLEQGDVCVTSVVDDRGREVLAGGPLLDKPERGCRGPLSRCLRLPLPARGARSISVKGEAALVVPKRSVPVELSLEEVTRECRAGWVTFRGSVKGVGKDRVWKFSARPDSGRLFPEEQFVNVRNGDTLYSSWSGWGKDGGLRALNDGSVEIVLTEQPEDVRSLRFTLVEGRATIRVPFELKDLVLPR